MAVAVLPAVTLLDTRVAVASVEVAVVGYTQAETVVSAVVEAAQGAQHSAVVQAATAL